MRTDLIYHLASESELRDGVRGKFYAPRRLPADGFVHCSPREAVLAVARDFFADLEEPLLLLEIDPALVTAETRFEPPAPIGGEGSSHLARARLFPHVYGPIDLVAIRGVGLLCRPGEEPAWPERFEDLGGSRR